MSYSHCFGTVEPGNDFTVLFVHKFLSSFLVVLQIA